MNEGMRDDAILWEVEPEGAGPFSRGALTVMPFQIGIVIRDGEVVDVFESGKRDLQKGDVRTYVASASPFRLTFWLKDPEDTKDPAEGAVLDQDLPVLTSDGEVVTGRIDLTLRAARKNVEYLFQLLQWGSVVVRRRDISDAIKGELLAKVLALDIRRHTAEELRGNRGLFGGLYESVNTELASTIRMYGLQLLNFNVMWGLTREERKRLRKQRQPEIDEPTKPRTDPPAPPVRPPITPRPGVLPQRPTPVGGYWVYEDRVTSQARVHEGRCRYCNHGEGMGHGRIPGDSEWYGPYGSQEEAFRRAEATGQRDVRGCKVCRPGNGPAAEVSVRPRVGRTIAPSHELSGVCPEGASCRKPYGELCYWVYEDRVTSQVRVHEGKCRYCNHGEGMGHGRIPGDSEWHGPYGSREEAFRRAEATGRREVRGCGVCRP